MQIEPATCPACSNAFNPLRARAIIVIDGRVRAFCSPACRDRGLAGAERPPAPTTDAHAVIALASSAWWRLPSEQIVLGVVAVVALSIFVLLLRAGRHRSAAATPAAATAAVRASKPERVTKSALTANDGPDEWIQPLAGTARHTTLRERRLFPSAREGLSAQECGGGRCAIELEAAPGDIVMAVHDGV